MAEYKVARSRLKRAVDHGEQLARLWNDIPSGRLMTPRAIVDPTGYGVLIASNVGEIPDDLPLLLGEMLYQLRSALDACIYQGTANATHQYPPPDEGKLEFPITADPKEWPGLVKRRLMHLPIATQEAIEKVQPYHNKFSTPEEEITSIARSLGILNDLARKDRHRKLHVIGSLPMDAKPSFVLTQGMTLDTIEIMPPSIIEDGTVLAKFRLTGFQNDETAQVNPQLRTTFGCVEPPPLCDTSDTFERRLQEMLNAVSSVISYFEGNV